MNLVDKLNSDKTIEETIHYESNSSSTQGRILDHANTTSGKSNEIKKCLAFPPAVDTTPQPFDLMEFAKQETLYNQAAIRLAKSRQGIKKLREEQEIEYGLNQLRYQLDFRNTIPLPETPYVDTPFPLRNLPDQAVRLVSEVADSLQVPKEAVIPALFGALFIASQGKFVVEVKSCYQEPVTGYIIVTMPSGSRKSAIVNWFRKPINKIEADLQINFYSNTTSRKCESEALLAIKKKLKSKIIKNLDVESPDDIEVAMKQLGRQLGIIELKVKQSKARPKLLIDSPTLKELFLEMVRQGEAIGIFEAEGGIWKHRIRSSEDDILLKGYTMEPSGYETTKVSATMQSPCLAICTYVQENITKKLYSNDELKYDGLLPRILHVFVPTNHEYRDYNPRDVSPEMVKMYSDKIHSLISIQRPAGQKGERTSHVLKLTNEARTLWQNYTSQIAERIASGVFKDFESFGEKLAGHAVRLASALHLLKYDVPHDHEIDAATMGGGIAFAEYFAKHASVAFGKSSLQRLEYAKKILQWIDLHGKTEFTGRDAQRGVGHCNIEVINAGMDALVQHGYIGCYRTRNKTYCIVNPKYRFSRSYLWDQLIPLP